MHKHIYNINVEDKHTQNRQAHKYKLTHSHRYKQAHGHINMHTCKNIDTCQAHTLMCEHAYTDAHKKSHVFSSAYIYATAHIQTVIHRETSIQITMYRNKCSLLQYTQIMNAYKNVLLTHRGTYEHTCVYTHLSCTFMCMNLYKNGSTQWSPTIHDQEHSNAETNIHMLTCKQIFNTRMYTSMHTTNRHESICVYAHSHASHENMHVPGHTTNTMHPERYMQIQTHKGIHDPVHLCIPEYTLTKNNSHVNAIDIHSHKHICIRMFI